jgi:hypothetical protein
MRHKQLATQLAVLDLFEAHGPCEAWAREGRRWRLLAYTRLKLGPQQSSQMLPQLF